MGVVGVAATQAPVTEELVAEAVVVVVVGVVFALFFFFSAPLYTPMEIFLFLYLMPQALHNDLGPSGPLLHKGVFVVLQSEQDFLFSLVSSLNNSFLPRSMIRLKILEINGKWVLGMVNTSGILTVKKTRKP